MTIKCIDKHEAVILLKQQITFKLKNAEFDNHSRDEAYGIMDALKIITDLPVVAELKLRENAGQKRDK